ncbi:hypothetical protein J6590_002664, partial [Homalodisca vitripennis]
LVAFDIRCIEDRARFGARVRGLLLGGLWGRRVVLHVARCSSGYLFGFILEDFTDILTERD